MSIESKEKLPFDTAPIRALLVGLMLVLAALTGCRGSATLGQGKPTLALTSTSFRGDDIPSQFTWDGRDDSPTWHGLLRRQRPGAWR
jgi:hypothetical protein